VGTCTIQLRDIKEVAQEKGTAKPQTWGRGRLWHCIDRIKYYRGRVFCNTTWNHTEEDKNFLQSLQQAIFLWTYLYSLILALHQQ